MTRTIWIAVFCLVGLAPAIAIKVVTQSASEAARDQARTEVALVPNEAAKSDRLPLYHVGAEARVMPAAEPEPSEAPATEAETTGIPGRHWRDANAKALPGEASGENAPDGQAELPSRADRIGRTSRVTPSERPHRHTIAKRPIESAANGPPKPREAWHCRQDAMGSVLRSLDLSPRCHM